MQQSDQQIILFEKIFYATKDRLFGFMKSILTDESKVQDCMQQCYLQLWERIDIIDTDKDVLPLLFTYSRNIAIDTLRKNAKYVWVDDVGIYSEQIGFENNAERNIQNKENSFEVNEVLQVLPPKRRQVFKLIKLYGYSYKEAALYLNISVNTVEKHMQEAQKSLSIEHLKKITVMCLLIKALSDI